MCLCFSFNTSPLLLRLRLQVAVIQFIFQWCVRFNKTTFPCLLTRLEETYVCWIVEPASSWICYVIETFSHAATNIASALSHRSRLIQDKTQIIVWETGKTRATYVFVNFFFFSSFTDVPLYSIIFCVWCALFLCTILVQSRAKKAIKRRRWENNVQKNAPGKRLEDIGEQREKEKHKTHTHVVEILQWIDSISMCMIDKGKKRNTYAVSYKCPLNQKRNSQLNNVSEYIYKWYNVLYIYIEI